MRRILLVLAASGAVSCHTGSTRGTDPVRPDELVATWSNACTCLNLQRPQTALAQGDCQSTNPADFCGDHWERLSAELLLFDDAKTVQAELGGDTLDLYWDSEGGVQHLGLQRGDGGCP